jgi:hypothetical protein
MQSMSVKEGSEREKERQGRILSTLVFVVLALVLIWPAVLHPTRWLWKPGSSVSDLAVSHWPNAHFTRRMLWEKGRFPVWRPTIMGGTPFAANPLAALYYVPNWPLLFLPWISLEVGFNLSALVHLSLAGATMYALMRSGLKASFWGGLVAGVAYQLSPKLLAHLGAGHVGWAQAWAWLPLVNLCTLRACQCEGGRRNQWALAAGVALAIQFCADVRLSAYTIMAAASLVMVRTISRLSDNKTKVSPDSRGALSSEVLEAIGAVALSIIVFAGLSACQWLPGLALLPETTRSEMTLSDAALYSLPWRYVSGLLLADHGGFHEWLTYVGISTLTLALVGIQTLWRGRRRRWLAVWLTGLATFAAWFSLGSHGGLFQALWRVVPGLGLLRVPPRAWVLVVFATAALAGLGLDALGRESNAGSRGSRRWRRAFRLGMASFPIMFVTGYALTLGRPPLNLIAFGLIGPLAVLLSDARLLIKLPSHGHTSRSSSSRGVAGIAAGDRASRNAAWLGAAAVLLITLDLVIVDFTLIEAKAPEDVFAKGQAAAEWLADQPGRFRVYSPSYSIPQQVAEKHDLELANGVDPLQLDVYADYLTRAAGLEPRDDYNVTLPPLPEASDVRTALRDVAPDAELLGQLGVAYVAADFPIPGSSLDGSAFRLVRRFDDTRIYRNSAAQTLPSRSGDSTITLADGRVLYLYRPWPVVVGWGISAITAIGALGWFIVRLRKFRYA